MKLKLALGLALLASPAMAEFDGPRVYWALPKNTNILSLSRFEGQANLSFQTLGRFQGDLDAQADLFVLTYIRSQPIFGRTTYFTASLPFGSLDTDSPLPLGALNSYADGIGDFQLGATINLFGQPELPVREFLRFDQRFSLGLGLTASFPTGNYDSSEALNLGSNRYSLRVSAPMVYGIGDWVQGRRTTLEVMPSMRVFTDNDNNLGNTVEQDPLYAIEAHLTRDITKNAYASLDYTWLKGGEQTFRSNASGAVASTNTGLDAQFLGATFGYTINDNMSLNVSHMQSLGGSGPDVDGSVTKLQFVWSWHDVLERRRDF